MHILSATEQQHLVCLWLVKPYVDVGQMVASPCLPLQTRLVASLLSNLHDSLEHTHAHPVCSLLCSTPVRSLICGFISKLVRVYE